MLLVCVVCGTTLRPGQKLGYCRRHLQSRHRQQHDRDFEARFEEMKLRNNAKKMARYHSDPAFRRRIINAVLKRYRFRKACGLTSVAIL